MDQHHQLISKAETHYLQVKISIEEALPKKTQEQLFKLVQIKSIKMMKVSWGELESQKKFKNIIIQIKTQLRLEPCLISTKQANKTQCMLKMLATEAQLSNMETINSFEPPKMECFRSTITDLEILKITIDKLTHLTAQVPWEELNPKQLSINLNKIRILAKLKTTSPWKAEHPARMEASNQELIT